MDVVVKGERAVVGDCVLLSCGDSERIMRVRDVDGCQIRLDGVVKSVEGNWCNVLVKCEQLGRLNAVVMFKTRLASLEFAERVHEWTRMNAKGIDRVRTTGTEECDFWAPLGESSF